MPHAKIKATVTRIDTLDRKRIGTYTMRRNVYQRANGSYYILVLGHPTRVTKQEDGTFVQRQRGRTVRDSTGNVLGIAISSG